MRVLITGATGALGGALVAHLTKNEFVERLCVLSRDEHKVRALADQYPEPNVLRYFVGDVRDKSRLMNACQGVDAVIHAAALKRVDHIVNNSIEIGRTNIEGTLNVLQAALECGVRKVLFVSSDKAVQPTNIYGASKMMAEGHCVGFNNFSKPRGMAVACVRYGNVFGSTGSILHIWRKAIADGKPLQLTDGNMTRFHMTLPQAVQFCLSSLQRMTGGEVFVPELPAFRLTDLAQAMLSMAGKPYSDATVQITGLRPGGEKLAEAMLSEEEPLRTVWQDDRYLVMPSHRTWSADSYRGVLLKDDPHLRSDWPSRWMNLGAITKALEETA